MSDKINKEARATLATERDTARLQTQAVRSSLELSHIARRAQEAELEQGRELLRQAAAQFREYERHHLAKDPPDVAKAARNASLAQRIEGHLKGQAPSSEGQDA